MRPGTAASARVVLLLLLASCGGAPGPRPDIVLVVWDTCRGDRVSASGFDRPTTPNLERLAGEGAIFRRCFAPAPWTAPAHASLFTGLLPSGHKFREAIGDRVRQGIPLLAETLRDAGYETVAVVANPLVSRPTGLVDGFETVIERLGGADRKGGGGEIVAALREHAAARRARPGRRPLFLFVNLMETHLPYSFDAGAVAAVHGEGAVAGARRAAGLVSDDRATGHVLGIDRVGAKDIEDLRRAYDGSVRLADRITGEILDLLRAEGLLGDSLVAVCGDHGESLGEHGDLGHLLSLRDTVLHVPLVIRWPGRFEGGRVVDEQVRLQDLYPTILEAAGAKVPSPCGHDAASLLASPIRARTVVAEYGPALDLRRSMMANFPAAAPSAFDRYRDALRAVREPGGRKVVTVVRHGEGGEPGPARTEEYDLAADPGETRDLRK